MSFVPRAIPIDLHRAALKHADAELESGGLLDASGNVAARMGRSEDGQCSSSATWRLSSDRSG